MDTIASMFERDMADLSQSAGFPAAARAAKFRSECGVMIDTLVNEATEDSELLTASDRLGKELFESVQKYLVKAAKETGMGAWFQAQPSTNAGARFRDKRDELLSSEGTRADAALEAARAVAMELMASAHASGQTFSQQQAQADALAAAVSGIKRGRDEASGSDVAT